MPITSPWKETTADCWDAQIEELGGEYRLEGGEGAFRRGDSRSLVWDCPRCERRVRLEGRWTHTDPCSDDCLFIGWSGGCVCGALVRIAAQPDDLGTT